jgi:integrase
MTAVVGLRPHEWAKAEVVWVSPAEIGDVDELHHVAVEGVEDALLPYLRVVNGKNTNGRSHGRYRHLNLSRLAPSVIEQVTAFAERMRAVHDSGQYSTFYQGAKKLLQRTNMKLHHRNAGKWVQIYSARHAFSTAAKKTLDQEGVAAAMGHATTKTASAHYGRRSVAGGGLGAMPVASEIMRVRLVRASRAAQIAAATPASSGPQKKHSA